MIGAQHRLRGDAIGDDSRHLAVAGGHRGEEVERDLDRRNGFGRCSASKGGREDEAVVRERSVLEVGVAPCAVRHDGAAFNDKGAQILTGRDEVRVRAPSFATGSYVAERLVRREDPPGCNSAVGAEDEIDRGEALRVRQPEAWQ